MSLLVASVCILGIMLSVCILRIMLSVRTNIALIVGLFKKVISDKKFSNIVFNNQ